MSAKRGRDKWEKVVDSIEKSEGEVVVSDDMKEYIASRKANYVASKSAFHPQMTAEEACHGQPIKSNVTDNFFHEDNSVVKEEGQNFLKDLAPILEQNHTDNTLIRNRFTNREAAAANLSARAASVIKQRADFMPIIMIPPTASSILQLWNVQEFVERGRFTEAHKKFINEDDGSTVRRDSEDTVIAAPGNLVNEDTYRIKFRTFKFVDNPSQVDNWDHVCACVVTGDKWQFDDWFKGDKSKTDPSTLFSEVKGFYPFFEEDKPAAQKDQWNVMPIVLTRKTTKSNTLHLRAASIFWEEIFKFLDSHPRFRSYTLPASQY